MSFTEFLITVVILFILFGVLRRWVYTQAYRSFTKAEMDFRRQNARPTKPEGAVSLDGSVKPKSLHDEGEYVDFEEVKD